MREGGLSPLKILIKGGCSVPLFLLCLHCFLGEGTLYPPLYFLSLTNKQNIFQHFLFSISFICYWYTQYIVERWVTNPFCLLSHGKPLPQCTYFSILFSIDQKDWPFVEPTVFYLPTTNQQVRLLPEQEKLSQAREM